MIPLIQGLRKPNQPIKTGCNTSFQLINKMGDDESIVEIDAMRDMLVIGHFKRCQYKQNDDNKEDYRIWNFRAD